MGLIMWLREPGRRGLLLARLYGEDSADALSALEEIRDAGWLNDRSLRGADLREVNLPRADLKQVDWEESRLTQANLAGADVSDGRLSGADFSHATLTDTNFRGAGLQEAVFLRAELQGANFSDADLRNADFTRADVSTEALRQARMLSGCTMPDGERYDGRFNLRGDIEQADAELYDIDDSEDMAGFYGVSREVYAEGQIDAPPIPKLTEVDEDDEPEEIGFGNFMRYARTAFDDPDEVEAVRDALDNRRSARVAAAWWIGVMFTLPMFLAILVIDVNQLLHPTQTIGLSVLVKVGLYGLEIVVLSGLFVFTGRSLAQGGSGGKVSGTLAAISAFFLGSSGYPIIIAYIFSLTIAMIFLGRAARRTLFWVSVFLVYRTVLALGFTCHCLPVFVGREAWKGLANVAIYLAITVMLLYALRILIQRHFIRMLGASRNSDLIGRGLLVLYGVLVMILVLVTSDGLALASP